MYKDLADELAMEMVKDKNEWEEVKATLNNQLNMLVIAKARLMELLGEARSNLAADRTELKEKYDQQEPLDGAYYHYMNECGSHPVDRVLGPVRHQGRAQCCT